MKIPIRHSFIGLILMVDAYLLLKGEECWIPMVCDDQLTWSELTCTKEEEKALEVLTEQLDGMKSELNQLKKVMETSETNSVPPSVVGVKETTTPSVVGVREMTTPWGFKDEKTSSGRTSTVPATTPWSTREAFQSTVRPQTTKVEQSTGFKDEKTSSARIFTVPATTPWSTKESFLSTFHPQTTKVEQSTENCGFTYKTKCFRAIVYDTRNVTLSAAESLCGNKLANIYDVTHLNLLKDYLRPMIPDWLSSIGVHTGMSYKNRTLYSVNGQVMTLSNETWEAGLPLPPYELKTAVAVRVFQNQSYHGGIRNGYTNWLRYGAICENDF
ncbi:uncharacterized protein LOC144427313 isoform X2 [Styela clava]